LRPTEVGVDEWRNGCCGEKQESYLNVRDEEQKLLEAV
jgi:hypothetical protein